MVSFRYLIAHFVSLSYTDWKFHDFSTTTRILRENNFGDFLSAKKFKGPFKSFGYWGLKLLPGIRVIAEGLDLRPRPEP